MTGQVFNESNILIDLTVQVQLGFTFASSLPRSVTQTTHSLQSTSYELLYY